MTYPSLITPLLRTGGRFLTEFQELQVRSGSPEGPQGPMRQAFAPDGDNKGNDGQGRLEFFQLPAPAMLEPWRNLP